MQSLSDFINEARNLVWMCIGGSTGKTYLVTAPNAQEAADKLKQFEEVVDLINIDDVLKRRSNSIILIDTDTVKMKGKQISYEE